jgi:ElaB/YqjD/DUF883 family membrane-anchored ribosome-binding protein
MNTQDAKEHAQDLLRETDNCIRANPVPAVLTALGIGFAIGVLTRFIDAPPRREPWQEVVDEIRGALATGTKRGKRAYADTADKVRDAVEQAVEKAQEIDIDPVAKWWKRLWS